jgi:competence protein ComEA
MEKLKKIPKVYWYLVLVISFAGYFAWKSMTIQAGPKLLISEVQKQISVSDNAIMPTNPPLGFYYEVSGEVVHPGVYTGNSNLLTNEAITRAGGYTSKADLDYVYRYIQLAVKVKPEQKIYIPPKNAQPLANISFPVQQQAGSKVNINSANNSQLEEISGVGPATSQKIIAGRPYQSCEDINKLKGVIKTTKENIIAACGL